MKEASWKKIAALCACLFLLLCASSAAAENVMGVQVGVPFQVGVMLDAPVSAGEVTVHFAFLPLDGSGAYAMRLVDAVPKPGCSQQVQEKSITLWSAGGFDAGWLCSLTFCLDAYATNAQGFLPYCVMANGQEVAGDYVLLQVGGQGLYAPAVSVGDTLTLGTYEQDNNIYNGKEPIVWRVLAVEGGRALVISDKVLDQNHYHPQQTAVTWETCWMRQWLNGEFFASSFTPQEQSRVLLANVPGHVSPYYNTESSLKSVGNDTQDRVFLLSAVEANLYFADNKARIAYPTQYLAAKDPDIESTAQPADWLMRQPHKHRTNTACVSDKGATSNGVNVSHARSGIRPAMWVSLP